MEPLSCARTSQAKCSRRRLQSLRAPKCSGAQRRPAASHTAAHARPLAPASAATPAGSWGTGGEGVIGFPVQR